MKNLQLLVTTLLVLAVGSAQAALPAGTEAIFTGMATDFGTLAGYGAVLMLVIVGGLAAFSIIKKVFNKAAS